MRRPAPGDDDYPKRARLGVYAMLTNHRQFHRDAIDNPHTPPDMLEFHRGMDCELTSVIGVRYADCGD